MCIVSLGPISQTAVVCVHHAFGLWFCYEYQFSSVEAHYTGHIIKPEITISIIGLPLVYSTLHTWAGLQAIDHAGRGESARECV